MNIEEEQKYKADTFQEIRRLIRKNDGEGLKALFDLDGFDVNMTNDKGLTALHIVATTYKYELLEVLTSHPNINLNAKDDFSMTPLMIAAKYGKLGTLKRLLEKGVDPLCSNIDGDTAFWIASHTHHLKCVEALLRSKKCVPDSQKETCTHALIYNSRIIGIVKKLITESSNDPYYVKTFGHTILHYGCKTGSLDTVKLIVEQGILDISSKEGKSQTPLQVAIRYSHLDIADYLIEKGAKSSIRDSNGVSAYDYAARFDNSETFLLKYEPEEEFLVNTLGSLVRYARYHTLEVYSERCSGKRYRNGPNILKTAVLYAFIKNTPSMAKLLTHFNDKKYIIRRLKGALLTHYKKPELFFPLYERFVELEADDSQIKKIRIFSLNSALFNRTEVIVDYFLERGLDPNEVEVGESYLMMTCGRDSTIIFEKLLKLGANVNWLSEYQDTALHYLAYFNNLETIQILLKHGADPHIRNDLGFTPLFVAAKFGCTDAFFELFKIDNDLSQRSNDQRTLFLVAFGISNVANMQIIKALVEAGACLTDVSAQNCNCLHYAASKDNICELMAYLFEQLGESKFKTMMTAVDASGFTPLDYARKNHGERANLALLLAIPYLADLIEAPTSVKMAQISNQETQELCLICRDDFSIGNSAVVLQCKHMFHAYCFSEWSRREEICPYCQKPIYAVKN